MSVLDTNLAAITEAMTAATTAAIRHASPRTDEIRTTSRDGLVINGLRTGDREILFHSRYDPRKEAGRIADTVGKAGFVVVLGAGMGYHIVELLSRGRTVVCIEPDPALWRSLLGAVDLSPWLAEGSLGVVGGVPDPESLTQQISRVYVPALDEALAVVTLPGRVAGEPELWDEIRSVVARSIDAIKDDLAVQARFGDRWTRNTLLNLRHARATPIPDWSGSTVVVAAAGPSLATSIPALRTMHGIRLIAVDTAFPVLKAGGVEPDMVVTIDCQLASYHHFLVAGPSPVPVAAELASPPTIVSQTPCVLPLMSAHPLHSLLADCGLRLPFVDVHGGNATHAAVDLARRSGAAGAVVVGADYSYPAGVTYPRGSYVHAHFLARAGRLRPLASLHYGFLLARPGVTRETSPHNRPRWVQPLLTRYGAELERLAEKLSPFPVYRLQADGLPLGIPTVDSTWPALPANEPGADRVTPGRSPMTDASGDVVRALLRARKRIAAVDTERRLRFALRSQSGDALAAGAIRPLLVCLKARENDADPGELVERAVRTTVRAIDAALAGLRASGRKANPHVSDE